MKWNVREDLGKMSPEQAKPAAGGVRHVAILFTDIVGFTDLTDTLGDRSAADLVNRIHTLLAQIISRDGHGRVIKFIGDSVFAVFDTPSQGLSRALETQRALSEWRTSSPSAMVPHLRMGLHMGEVLLELDEQLDIVGRHVNRARRVMEAADGDQILTTRVVIEAGKDFIEGVDRENLAIRYYGEYYLKGVGATELCEIADRRIRKPHPPRSIRASKPEATSLERLKLAGYEALERLGEGAFGVAYRARQHETGREVAVKVLSPSVADRDDARLRFVQEVARLHELRLPGVAQILEAKMEHNPPFFAMELIKGRRLDTALADRDPKYLANVFREICLTLGRAHDAGVIHCDLKPSNILVDDDGRPMVVDFGLSWLVEDPDATTSGSSTELMGTPTYMAPEQLTGGQRVPQTDVYSLGAILFEMLTNRPPFQGRSVHDVVDGHLHEDPPFPSMLESNVPEGLQRICLKALEKEPCDRYQTMEQMADDLGRYLRGDLVRTRPQLYDNLIFHRVNRHVQDIEAWRKDGLLNPEEHDRLLANYEGLLRRGVSAVMEGRRLRLWRTLVYLGAWTVVNGAAIWLTVHWDDLSTPLRLLLGSVPALATFALAGAMLRKSRFRLTFVALVIGVLAFPLLIGVWVYELDLLGTPMLDPNGQQLELVSREAFMLNAAGEPVLGHSTGITNRQLFVTCLFTLLVAVVVMRQTGTVTHSAQTAVAAVATYLALHLLLSNLPLLAEEQYAAIALRLVPLLLGTALGSAYLVSHLTRHPQASPWLYLSAGLLIYVCLALPRDGIDHWLEDYLDNDTVDIMTELAMSLSGVVLLGIGLKARRFLQHRGRLPTLAVVLTGQLMLLIGLGTASYEWWDADWWGIDLLGPWGEDVPPPLLAMPVVSIAMTLFACRVQLRSFILIGLGGFAVSLYVLGHEYFDDAMLWPALLILFGVACFTIALQVELRRTRGHAIDDVELRARL